MYSVAERFLEMRERLHEVERLGRAYIPKRQEQHNKAREEGEEAIEASRNVNAICHFLAAVPANRMEQELQKTAISAAKGGRGMNFFTVLHCRLHSHGSTKTFSGLMMMNLRIWHVIFGRASIADTIQSKRLGTMQDCR